MSLISTGVYVISDSFTFGLLLLSTLGAGVSRCLGPFCMLPSLIYALSARIAVYRLFGR